LIKTVLRKVIYLVASSLDGKIAREDGSFDCFLAEGEHVTDYLQSLTSFDDVLMGRSTYEVGLNAGVTNPYPGMRSHVFSQTMRVSPDKYVQLVTGDAAEYVKALRHQPGRDIYLCGGARLAASLLAANLIDEIVVKLNPLLIGPGIPLFAWIQQPLRLELINSKIYANGVLLLSYRVGNERL
jgi:dihydrofolate reductase